MAKRAQSKVSGRSYLDGQLLVAMPGMQDNRFAKSVIYVCAHSADGAMGIMINQPAPQISFHDLLVQLGLGPLMFRPAMGLPFGTLKRLEIARALAARPTFLLMDEPASGLTHSEVDELGQTIVHIRDQFDLTVLLVEHHMSMVMGISDKVVAMEFGRKIAEEGLRTSR